MKTRSLDDVKVIAERILAAVKPRNGEFITEAVERVVSERDEALADLEICMEVLDKLAYPTTIGPAILDNLGVATSNEIHLRCELADRERKRTQAWKRTEKEIDDAGC